MSQNDVSLYLRLISQNDNSADFWRRVYTAARCKHVPSVSESGRKVRLDEWKIDSGYCLDRHFIDCDDYS